MQQQEMTEGTGTTKGLIIGLLAGGLLGAGIALLYAPKAGRKLRAELRDKAEDLVEQGQEYVSTVQEKASEIVEDAKRGLTQLFRNTEKEITRSVRNSNVRETNKV